MDLGLGERSKGMVQNDDRADWSEAWSLFPGDVVYCWHGALHAETVAKSLVDSGFMIRSQIIWAKQHFVISRGDYHWQHEPCWYAVKKNRKGHWSGDRKQSTIWTIDNSNFGSKTKGSKLEEKTGHGTQKPVECMKRPIENNSSPGQVVYDPFLGSGTTVIAAEVSGRTCFGMELSSGYVDAIIRRWQIVSGEKAKLEGDGRTYEELVDERQKACADAT